MAQTESPATCPPYNDASRQAQPGGWKSPAGRAEIGTASNRARQKSGGGIRKPLFGDYGTGSFSRISPTITG